MLPALMIVGAILRLLGIDFGLPQLLHPDEGAVVNPASHMILDRTLDPAYFGRPNHFSIYWSAVLYGPLSAIVLDEPFAVVRENHPWFLHLTSRLVVAGMGTVSIVAAYYLGSEFNLRVGYVLAAIFAVFPLYVLNSHYATPDVPLTLLLTLVVLFTVRFMRTGSLVDIGLAIVAAALSTIEKYPGALSILAVLAVLVVAHRRHPRILVISVAGSLIAFGAAVAVFSPYLMLRFSDVLAALETETRGHHLGQTGLSSLGNLGYYAATYYQRAGLVVTVATAVGLIALLRRRDVRVVPLLFAVPYWVALSTLALHWERWALPMFVGPLTVAAIGLDEVRRRVQLGWHRPSMAAVAVALALVISFGGMGFGSIARSVAFTLEDTRMAALNYLARRGITQDQSVYDGYTPFRPGSPGSAAHMVGSDTDKSIRYAVLSSFSYRDYLREPDRFSAEARFYCDLMRDEPLATFASEARLHEANEMRGVVDFIPEVGRVVHGVDYLVYLAVHPDSVNGPTIYVFRYPPRVDAPGSPLLRSSGGWDPKDSGCSE